MQDAIQSQEKINGSLYNLGCDHTGGGGGEGEGEKCTTSARNYLFEKKEAYSSGQNLAIWERRGEGVCGGRRASAARSECPVFMGHARNAGPPRAVSPSVCV